MRLGALLCMQLLAAAAEEARSPGPIGERGSYRNLLARLSPDPSDRRQFPYQHLELDETSVEPPDTETETEEEREVVKAPAPPPQTAMKRRRALSACYVAVFLLVTGTSYFFGFCIGQRARDTGHAPQSIRPDAVFARFVSPIPDVSNAAVRMVKDAIAGDAVTSTTKTTTVARRTLLVLRPAPSTTTAPPSSTRTSSHTTTTTTTSTSTNSSAASCAAYGCTAYVPRQRCQCDSSCESFGNCCPDYRICGGCKVYGCGSFDRSQLCQCDASCERFGNCCPDAGEACD